MKNINLKSIFGLLALICAISSVSDAVRVSQSTSTARSAKVVKGKIIVFNTYPQLKELSLRLKFTKVSELRLVSTL